MKEKFQVIKTIHLCLVFGILLAYFFIGELESLNFLNFNQIDSSNLVYLLIPVIAIILGNYLYKIL